MAKRLIDANELENKLRDYEFAMLCPLDEVDDVIDRCQTVDAVEVVRCRDCRRRGSEQCGMFYRCNCCEQHTWETDDDFCSYGERRDDHA